MIAWETLFARRTLGVRPGLAIIQAVYDALGAPGRGVPTVHVVGTNGKGSTAALVEHGLRGRGLRTGLYTSPHLQRVTERVKLDAEPVPDARLLDHVEAVLRAEAGLSLARPLSFFELLTLAALRLFEHAPVDVMVVEAGLGARGDATRVIQAQAVGITSIGLDHLASFGPMLVDIAHEKAGAMAPGVPTFSAPQPAEVMTVLLREAEALGCPLEVVEPRPRAPRGLRGEHQRINAALALALGRTIVPTLAGDELDGVSVPGRLERIAWSRGALWLDVAHNPHGIAAVVAAIQAGAVASPAAVVFGCHADKDREGMLALLHALGCPLWWVPIDDPHDGPAMRASDRTFAAVDDPRLWPAIAERAATGGELLICGSHMLVGAIRARVADLDDPADPQDPRPR